MKLSKLPGRVSGKAADILGGVFYGVVAAVALAGQTSAAVGWLHWSAGFALPAVAALELGGIALAARADFRRRLGERALAARILSAAVAAFAVGFNWIGHADHRAGAFFAGMSALGYAVWLINSGDRRRDQLRADGKLPEPGPVYGVVQWLAHPWVTRRARLLAKAQPELGLYGSLAASREAIRTERRQAAIAALLRRKLTAGRDKLAAEIATTTFDLDEIARRLSASADYDGLTRLLAVDLAPERLAAVATAQAPSVAFKDDKKGDSASDKNAPRVPRQARHKARQSTASRVVAAARRSPDATVAQIAAKLKLSPRTVQRHMPPPVAAGAPAVARGVARVVSQASATR